MPTVPQGIIEPGAVLYGVNPDNPNSQDYPVSFGIEPSGERTYRAWIDQPVLIAGEGYGYARGSLGEEHHSPYEARRAIEQFIEAAYSSYSFELDIPRSGGETTSRAARSTRNKPQTAGEEQSASQDKSEAPAQTDRAKQDNSDNHRAENISDPTDIPDDPKNGDRADTVEPETEYTGGTFLEDVEHWIPSLFEPARQGINSLKNELESDVDEGNWLWKAAGASALDLLGGAMSTAEGMPLGLLDARRLGEGVAEGTWEGVRKDISRLSTFFPGAKILSAVDRVMAAGDIVQALGQGNIGGAAIAVSTAVLAVALHAKGAKGSNKAKKSRSKPAKIERIKKLTQKNPKALVYSEDPLIAAHGTLKGRVLKKTGMDSNHLLKSEWFEKGPAHLQGLEEFVPAIPLGHNDEHQITWHGTGVDPWYKNKNLFKKKGYSQQDVERAIDLTEKWLRSNSHDPLFKAYADAVTKFRVEIFNKVKK
jgi:hypothetical protein